MDEEIKRWTAKRKTALELEIIQGKTSVAEASRSYDLAPSEIESWVEDGRKGMENALKANSQDVREQYERQLKELQEAYGEAMLAARKQNILKGKKLKGGGRSTDTNYYVRKVSDDAYSVTITDKSNRIISIDSWKKGGETMTKSDITKALKNSGITPPQKFWSNF
jgi:transposase-like protein